jgi:uncharacterized protein YuzE
MSKVGPFLVRYDPNGDVLYIHVRREAATKAREDPQGVVWRYATDGTLIGVTLLDFRDSWLPRKAALADEISRRFSVPFGQASAAIESAAREAV